MRRDLSVAFYRREKFSSHRIERRRFVNTILDRVRKIRPKERKIIMLDRIALIIAIIGGINWGSIGLFKFDIVAWICGGQGSLAARIIYTVVGLASIWCISLLFRETNEDYSRE